MDASNHEGQTEGLENRRTILDSWQEFFDSFVKPGDTLMLHSDVTPLLFNQLRLTPSMPVSQILNQFLELWCKVLTPAGTLLVPAFTWAFCQGKPFNIRNTPPETGGLSKAALKHPDFRRTRHPIYSFAACGKHQSQLCEMRNSGSFEPNSPFGFAFDQDAVIILMNIDFQSGFTFAHFIEESLGVPYRFHKPFSGEYTDEDGITLPAQASMFVRDLEMGINTWLRPIGEILLDAGVAQRHVVEGNTLIVMRAKRAFERIADELQRIPDVMVRYDRFKPFPQGQAAHDLMRRLFSIPRSLTGAANRRTLSVLKEVLPDLTLRRISSGTDVFGWTIPREWSVEEAYIEKPDGSRICEYKNNPLHLLSYSTPVDQHLSYAELNEHLYSIEDLPTAIPYLTSYYRERWGFCLSHNERQALSKEATYRAVVKTSLESGMLDFADAILPGDSSDEVLLSCYICHPNMANDSLSGVVLAALLGKWLKTLAKRHFSYRLVFIPETIGAVAYLARNGEYLRERLRYGLVLTCVGDEGIFHYKRSRQGKAQIDLIVENLLQHSGLEHRILDFTPNGSDERQYCSPGFDFPVGSLMKTPYARFNEYHTSLDDLSLITPKGLEESLVFYQNVIQAIEANHRFENTHPMCEPFLTRYDLRPTLGSQKKLDDMTEKVPWLLNLADGSRTLVEIAQKAGYSILELVHFANLLEKVGLFRRV